MSTYVSAALFWSNLNLLLWCSRILWALMDRSDELRMQGYVAASSSETLMLEGDEAGTAEHRSPLMNPHAPSPPGTSIGGYCGKDKGFSYKTMAEPDQDQPYQILSDAEPPSIERIELP